jgi:hypothetical protein
LLGVRDFWKEQSCSSYTYTLDTVPYATEIPLSLLIVMIGILTTVLVQSSSTSTSIIVSMVSAKCKCIFIDFLFLVGVR